MAKHELETAEHDNLGFPKAEITVAVTLDGGYWSDQLEALQYGIGADVAGVQDVVDSGEEFGYLAVEDAVGVGDYSYRDHGSIRPAPLFILARITHQ